jgi:2-methylcitrate dehydratase PrpD
VSTPTLTENLASYWASARFEDLPADTVQLAKRFLIDTLSAGIAGAHTNVVKTVLAATEAGTEGAVG